MFLKLLQPVYPLELVAYSGSEEVVQFRAKKSPITEVMVAVIVGFSLPDHYPCYKALGLLQQIKYNTTKILTQAKNETKN
jgi:hypothetical protein